MLNTTKYSPYIYLFLLSCVLLIATDSIATPYLEKKLSADTIEKFNHFGSSVAMTENFSLIGSPGKSTDKGTACIFKYDQSRWTFDVCLNQDSSTLAPLYHFGQTVSISNSTAAITATYSGLGRSGIVLIFEHVNGSWVQTHELISPESVPNDNFGASVSIYDNFIAIGSPGGSNLDGAVYVYHRTEHSWAYTVKIESDSQWKSKLFGSAVALSGDYLIVGDPERGKAKEGGPIFIFTMAKYG